MDDRKYSLPTLDKSDHRNITVHGVRVRGRGRGVVKYQSTSKVLAISSCKYCVLSKISPLPSLTLKFLHKYVCLDQPPTK